MYLKNLLTSRGILKNTKTYKIAKIRVITHSEKDKTIFDGIWDII